MMVMTAKVDIKKILLILAGIAAVLLALILMLGGNSSEEAAATAVSQPTGNDARVKFLTDLGWEVTTSPKESGQVKIPSESSAVFDRYNALQKSQGYDLSPYAGKKVMRYVYQVNNYPGATGPVYATLLVHKNKVIGGDITDTSPGGHIQSLKAVSRTPSQTTAPTTPLLPQSSTQVMD